MKYPEDIASSVRSHPARRDFDWGDVSIKTGKSVVFALHILLRKQYGSSTANKVLFGFVPNDQKVP